MLFSVVIEIIILSLLIGGGIFGYRRGLFRLAFMPIRFFVCLVFAFCFFKGVGDNLVFPAVAPAVENYLKELLAEHIQSDNTVESLPTLLKIFVGLSTLEGNGNTEWTLDGLLEMLAAPFSALVSRIIAFVILFILAILMLKLTVFFVDRLFDRGIIGRINAILGVLFSCCISALLACCFVSLLDYLLFLDIFSVGDFSGGVLFRFFREVSLIRLLLSF